MEQFVSLKNEIDTIRNWMGDGAEFFDTLRYIAHHAEEYRGTKVWQEYMEFFKTFAGVK